MNARLRSMTDEQLGTAIASLPVTWPPAPDLAPAVMATARSSPPRVARLPLSRSKRIVLVAAAVVLLLAGAAVAAKILIDLGAVVVEVAPRGPGILPSPTTVPFGRPITADEAADVLGEEVPLPAVLGPPDRIWADRVITDAGTVVRVTLAWRPRPDLPAIEGSRFGAVLMRFEGETDLAFKEAYEDTGTVRQTRVGSRDAVWTTGPHLLQLLTGEGVIFVRVDGNVLLWPDEPYTLRLETSLREDDAVRIAVSVPGTS